ncbi:MAG: alkaline phosphatase [Chloroflexi bacterium]|nr:alkaline phosphatase [Chloroflexota bacterium]
MELITEIIHSLETAILNFTNEIYEFMGWWGIIVLMSIESTALPLPSEIIMPLAGWLLVSEKNLSIIYVFFAGFYGAIGSLIGSLIEYYVCRIGGRPLLEKYGKYILITKKDIDKAENLFLRRGEIIVIIARLIPGVRGFISIPAGLAKMNVIKFSLFTFLGAFPWTFGLSLAGYILGDNYKQIREIMKPFDIPIFIIILLLISWFIYKRINEIRNNSN